MKETGYEKDMSGKKNVNLFKDRINKSNCKEMAKELITAVDAGDDAVHRLLFGLTDIDEYSNHGSYKKEEMHNHCTKLAGSRFTEKRLCRCLYYKNNTYPTSCETCDYKDRFDVIGDYQIIDYEVPAFYYGDGIGEIDLMISDGENAFATEVKPYKNNNETLLRMIAEIMTYTSGYPDGTYKKAIAYFEKNYTDGSFTAQQKEFEKKKPEISELIEKADITVFRFEIEGDRKLKICKL